METVCIQVDVENISIKPSRFGKHVEIEANGIELSDLIETIDNIPAILNIIGAEKIADYILNHNLLSDVLAATPKGDIEDWLEETSWKPYED